MGSATTHILIVEDELIVAHSIKLRLEQRGYSVAGIAKSGEDALSLLETLEPSLILMDIRLSGEIDGIDTAEQIRRDHSIPIIFLTAYSDDETLARVKITEPFGYIIKPFETRELVNNIEIALYRKQLSAALETSEARFRGLFESAAIGLVLLDNAGSVVAANPGMHRLLSVGETDAAVDPYIAQLTAAGSEPSEVGIDLEDGTRRLFSVTTTTIPQGPSSPPHTALFVEDVTELRRYERELQERQDALRALFVNEEAIRTEERTRLSRDIHDVLGQMLTAHKMDLHWIREKDEAERDRLVPEMMGHMDEMISFVKRVCSELRDNVLDVFGFDVALEEHLKQFEERTGVKVQFRSGSSPSKLGRDREVSLLRIIQEALTNVTRHAEASHVYVASQNTDTSVEWRIRDDGAGFDPSAEELRKSLGLVGMRERAAIWGGSVLIDSSPTGGTEVRVRLPLTEDGA